MSWKGESPTRSRLVAIGLVLLAFLTARVLAFALLRAVIVEKEPTDDLFLWLAMSHFPFANLFASISGVTPGVTNYFPLASLPVLPLSYLAEFIGISVSARILFVIFDGAALAVSVRLAIQDRLYIALFLALAPHGWLATAVFAQEEFISALFVGLAVLGLYSRRFGEPIVFVAIAGILLCTKPQVILLLIPLLPVLYRQRRRGTVLSVGVASVVLALWIVEHCARRGAIPVWEALGRNYRALSPLSILHELQDWPVTELRLASACFFIACAAVVLATRWARLSASVRDAAQTAVILNALFVLLFYQSYPEYLLWSSPLVIASAWRYGSKRGGIVVWWWSWTITIGFAVNAADFLRRMGEAPLPGGLAVGNGYVAAFLERFCEPLFYGLGVTYTLALLGLLFLAGRSMRSGNPADIRARNSRPNPGNKRQHAKNQDSVGRGSSGWSPPVCTDGIA